MSRKKILKALVIVALIFGIFSYKSESTIQRSMYKSSVMITNLKENSGGSGVILFSGQSKSYVLTNSHVCGVAKNGGLVTTFDDRKFKVESYRPSQLHDLCLIEVNGELKNSAPVSSTPPIPYETKATAVGHPDLLPITTTQGFFSRNHMVAVLVGSRECTEAEKADPNVGLVCIFFGKLPIVKRYEATSVSALIQPGSSGSPIFNGKGEVEALVFAGSGAIGFAEAVPHGYIVEFLADEVKNVAPVYPDYSVMPDKSDESFDIFKIIEEKCANPKGDIEASICKRFNVK